MTDATLPFAEKKFIEIEGHHMAYIDEGEGARIVFVDIRLGAKEGHLKPKRLALFSREPSRDIPPLGPKLRMTSQVFGKLRRMSRRNRRIRRARRSGRSDQGARQQKNDLAHQSSRTARTAS